MVSSNPQRSLGGRWLTAAILALWAALAVCGLWRAEIAPESRIMETSCRLLIDNTDEGRQALVSSVWWPPLPVLARLPFAFFTTGLEIPVASVIVSALFGSLAVFYLGRTLSRRGGGWWGWLVAALLLIQPGFLDACMNGSNVTMLVALSILSAGGLTAWIQSRTTGELLRFAFATSLLLVTAPESWPWIGLSIVVLIGDLFFRSAEPREREAVLLLALSPVTYMACLWLLLNWLVMGDWLYFIRSLAQEGPGSISAPVEILPFAPALTVLGLAVVCGLFQKDRAVLPLLLLAAGPLAAAVALQSSALPWHAEVLFHLVAPLSLLAIGRTAALSVRARRVLQPAALACALVMAAPPWLAPDPAEERIVEKQQNIYMLQGIRRHVLQRSPYAKVFVCGYESFHLLHRNAGPVFAHSLDFNFEQVKNAYRGHTLFVLVRKPTGPAAMDSVHWQHKDIYALGSRSTLYDGDWGDWRLYEIIEAPRRRIL